MRRNVKDLDACIAILQRFQASGAVEPSRTEGFARAVADLRKFGRVPRPDKAKVFRAVRVIAEILCDTYSLGE